MDFRAEIEKTASYLRSARKAVLGRGGEISATAGLKDLPSAIFNIPADTSLAFYEDSTSAYKKTVTINAEDYAMIKRIGGKTIKEPIELLSADCIDEGTFTGGWYDEEGGINHSHNITVTRLADGSYKFSGEIENSNFSHSVAFGGGKGNYKIDEKLEVGSNHTASAPNLCVEYEDEQEDGTWLTSSASAPSTFEAAAINYIEVRIGELWEEHTGTVDFTIKPSLTMVGYGTLEDTKVTALESKGANLIPFPYRGGNETTIAGITFQIGNDGGITASGTQTGSMDYYFTIVSLPAGTYTYSISGVNKLTSVPSLRRKDNSGFIRNLIDVNPNRASATFTITEEDAEIADLWINFHMASEPLNGETIYPMLNRGAEALPYKPPRENIIVDTFALSAELRAFLEEHGYGKGIPDTEYYNYIDWERKVVGERAKTINLADFVWAESALNSGSENPYISVNNTVSVISRDVRDFVVSDGSIAVRNNSLCNHLPTVSDWRGLTRGVCLVEMNTTGQHYIRVTLSVYECGVTQDMNYRSIREKLIDWITDNQPILTYPLETPIETPIPANLLTNDNFIKVEGGGTITAVNEPMLDVPTTIKYTKKTEG